ncbi:hypothetical protein [Rufibacter roseus]|uniref:Glycosyltransferase RgtA/B/C/D-like domain-containing protein n=1 Tax=Rufibacter roseus TaxID=1567108 RepID=A0ABW2DLG3_9BACT|nr:hypothetical protein [Rufibacter roseus]
MPLHSNWLHLPVFFLLVYWLWRSLGKPEQKPLIFWSALLLKLVCGILLGWLYLTYLPGGDTWGYHKQAAVVANWATDNPVDYLRFLIFNEHVPLQIRFKEFSNTFFFLKPLSLLHLFTGNSYWGSSLYLSLFSFWGCWFLVSHLRRHFPQFGTAATISFLFFPSVVFWTSGVTKDSVLMGSLCFTIGLFLQILKQEQPKPFYKYLLLIPAIWLLWRIKFFLAAVLIVLMVTHLLLKTITQRVVWLQSKERQLLAWSALMSGGAFVASFAHPTFNLSFFVRHIVWNYRNIMAVSDPEKPLLVVYKLQPSLWSVIQNAPSALLQMVFRPFIWEPAPLFYKLAGIENLLIALLVVVAITNLVRHKKFPSLPAFLGVLLLFFVIGGVLVSLPTPNFGSLHRYRAPLLPFFLLPILAWGPVPQWLRKLL